MTAKKADEFEGGLVPSVAVDEASASPGTVEVSAGIEATPEAAAKLAEALGGGTDIDAVKALINQAMAARDAEISALRAELETVKVSRPADGLLGDSIGGYPWMFWKKPENWPSPAERGWISYGPGGPTPNGNRDAGSYTRYLRKGLIPITRYGYIEPPRTPNAVDVFLALLRAGGAKEFPASQVIAFNWHIRPPIKGLVFPQYEAIKAGVISFICEACGHTMFFMPDQKGVAGDNYRAHLMGAHKYPFREAAEAVRQSGLTMTSFAAPRAISEEAPV